MRTMRIEHYELMTLFPMSYTSEEVPALVKKVMDSIAEHKGTVTKDVSMGKQKLAYPIENMSHGYYHVYEFDLPTDQAKTLNRALQLMKEVTRYMLLTRRIKGAEELASEAKFSEKLARMKADEAARQREEGEEDQPRPRKRIIKKAPAPKEKMTMEQLDKKLEDILENKDVV